MTEQKWLATVREQKGQLATFIQLYHPSSALGEPLPITAPNAEIACEQFRGQIKVNRHNPVKLFLDAVETEDTNLINDLLSETWLGVPESTSCWQITGFATAVDLMDDPIEEEGDEQT